MSRSLVVTTVLASALASATTVWLTTLGASGDPSAAEPEAHVQASRPRRVRRPRVDLRPRIEQEEARALPGLNGKEDVAQYLDQLEARARAQGHASALEIEPGMTAIFALRGDVPESEMLAMADAFDARMQALSAELGAPPRPEVPALEDALARVQRSDDPEDRAQATREALEALETLDEPARRQAEAELDEALGGPTAETSSPVEHEVLRQAIDEAPEGEARERAVRRYVEAVENLPREEADAMLAEVEKAEVPGVSLL